MKASIIIPAFNEEKSIEECVQLALREIPKAEIIIVNDGSTDNTEKIAKKIAKKNKRVQLVSFKKNNGKGFAVREGIKKSNGKFIAILDADCSVKPKEIKKFFKELEKEKKRIIIGNRFFKKMEKNAMPSLHILGNRFFALLFSIALRQKIHDTLCGTKAFANESAKKMHLEENSWPDFELLFKAKKIGLEIIEVPVTYHARKHGESKMKTFKDSIGLLWQFTALLLKHLF